MLETSAFRPLPGVWSVAALLSTVSELLGAGLGACSVRGELSGFSRAPSGHCYFNLKDIDGGASLRCAMFRRAASLLDFTPLDGQRLDLRGRVAVYEPRGELQFIVESARRSGEGALYEQFLRLRSRLESEGLFGDARKRALPLFPRRVGVVTSLAAAALHDIVSALGRRSPHVEIVVYPSLVQGVDAPAALCAAIARAGARAEVDVLIIGRGGGSLEDLWAFNDERVVRAIAVSPVPVISGVGHETDVTLADLVADLRAPTPTAAAELAAPAAEALLDALDLLTAALQRRARGRLDTEAQRLDRAAMRLARPSDTLRRRSHALDLLAQSIAHSRTHDATRRRHHLLSLQSRLLVAAERIHSRASRRVDSAAGRLHALDPSRVLARGYALLTDGRGRAITSISQTGVGEAVQVALYDGTLSARVEGTAVRDPKI